LERAKKNFKHCLKLDPDDESARKYLGLVVYKEKQGQYQIVENTQKEATKEKKLQTMTFDFSNINQNQNQSQNDKLLNKKRYSNNNYK
jgi:hypothetical protein